MNCFNFLHTVQNGHDVLFTTIKRRARRAARFCGAALFEGYGGFYFFIPQGDMPAPGKLTKTILSFNEKPAASARGKKDIAASRRVGLALIASYDRSK